MGDGALAGPLRITRFGTGSPAASIGKTVAEWLPKFVTHSSLFFRSRATPVGFLIMLRGPLRIRMGATSPSASARYTVTLSPVSLATNNSPRSGCTAIDVGQFIKVLGP